jgi:hypothetical protein
LFSAGDATQRLGRTAREQKQFSVLPFRLAGVPSDSIVFP